MSQNSTPQRPTTSVIWIYACGQLGWSLVSYGISSLLSYFYMPPEEAGKAAIFPSFLPSTMLFGLTLLGVIAFGGRLLDAFIDPFIANMSDKTTSKLGKRRTFMGIAAVPLAVLSYLIFAPNTEGVSVGNAWYLAVVVFAYYIFFAMYVIPYSALIAELGHVAEDRLKISTILSVTWALGFLIGNLAYALQGFLESGGTPSLIAFQWTMLIFAFIALVFLLIPVLFLDEKKYAAQGVPHENFLKSIASVLENQPFRIFAFSYLLYWLALTFIQMGIAYYLTILFGLPKEMATLFGVVSFFASFLFYPLMGKLERGFSKKKVMLVGFGTFCLIFICILLPISGALRFWFISITAAFPLAIFGILPNTIVADIVHRAERDTGKNQAGMFYAAAAFMMKVGISLANLIFPSLLVFGKSAAQPLGVQLSVVAALIFCVWGFLVFRRYDEQLR
ncbi:MAG: MFS transporter [Saprospiraceae bacterium]|nr:MFS transporter [Saprospiraceae bacterium]